MRDLPQSIDIRRAFAQIGPIFQFAWVPQDFEAAIEYWLQVMGVGPFFVLEHIPMVDTQYYGRPTPVDMTVANAFWGDLQIELIKQHNADETIYTTWRDGGQRGPHHIAIVAPDMDAAAKTLSEAGEVIAQEGVVPNGCEYRYYDMGGIGPYVEIGRGQPGFLAFNEFMKAETVRWDGGDAVRVIPRETYLG